MRVLKKQPASFLYSHVSDINPIIEYGPAYWRNVFWVKTYLVPLLKVENYFLSVDFNVDCMSLETERIRNAILDLIITIYFASLIKSAVYI